MAARFTIDTSPLVDKAVRQLAATGTFLREVNPLDAQKTKFLTERIRVALRDIRKAVDAQRTYDEQQLDETTKFSNRQRPDAEAVAKQHADFIVTEARKLLKPTEVEVYEVRVVNPIDAVLKRENADLKRQLADRGAELLTAQAEIRELQRQLATLDAEKKLVEEQLRLALERELGLERDIHNLKARIRTLETDLLTRTGELTAEQGVSRGLRGDLSTRTGELTAEQGVSRGLRGDLATRTGERDAARGDLATRTQELATRTQELTAEQGVSQGLRGDVLRITNAKDAEILRLTNELAAEKLALQQLQGLHTKLQQDSTDAADIATKALAALQARYDALEKQRDEIEAARAKLATEVQELTAELETLKGKLQTANEETIAAKAAQHEAGNKASALAQTTDEEHKRAIKALEEKLRLAEEEYARKLAELNTKLAAQTGSAGSDAQTIATLQTKVKELEAQLAKAVSDATDALRAQQATSQVEISRLGDELRDAQDALSKAQSEHSAALALAAATHRQELDQLRAQHVTAIKELQDQLNAVRTVKTVTPEPTPLAATPPQSMSDSTNIQELTSLLTRVLELKPDGGSDLGLDREVSNAQTLVDRFSDTELRSLAGQTVGTINAYMDALQSITKLTDANAKLDARLQEQAKRLAERAAAPTESEETARLRQSLEEIQRASGGVAQKLEEALATNETLKLEIQNLQSELAGVREENVRLTDENDKFKELFSELGGMLGELAQVLGVSIPANMASGGLPNEFLAALNKSLGEKLSDIRKYQAAKALSDLADSTNRFILDIQQKIKQQSIRYKESYLEFLDTTLAALTNKKIDLSKASDEESDASLKGIRIKASEAIDNLYESLSNLRSNIAKSAEFNDVTSQKLYDDAINELYTAVNRIGNDRLKILTPLRAERAQLDETIRNINYERDTAMQTINALAQETITFLTDFSEKAGIEPDEIAKLKRISPTSGLNPDEPSDRAATIIDEYQNVNARWETLMRVLPSALNNVMIKIVGEVRKSESAIAANERLLDEVNAKFVELAKEVGMDEALSTISVDSEQTKLVDTVIQKFKELAAKVTDLQATNDSNEEFLGVAYEKLQVLKKQEQEIERLRAVEKSVAELTKRNKVLAEGLTDYIERVKVLQQQQPPVMRTGTSLVERQQMEQYPDNIDFVDADTDMPSTGRMSTMDRQQTAQKVMGGNAKHNYTGGSQQDYTPMIAVAAGGLLWWGFGGLLVFLLLLVIYFLGKEIYNTQFKSETHSRIYCG